MSFWDDFDGGNMKNNDFKAKFFEGVQFYLKDFF